MRSNARYLFGLLLMMFCFEAAAAAETGARAAAYEVTPVFGGEARLIKIAARFRGEADGTTKILLPSEFGGQAELYKAVRNLRLLTPGATLSDGEKPDEKIVRHRPRAEIRLDYEIVQDWTGVPQAGGASSRAGGGYRPILQKDYFHFLGSGAWIIPDLPERGKLRVSLEWKNVPAGWTLANSFGADQLKQNFATDRESFASSVYVGGDFQLRQRRVGGKPVFTAQRGKWKFAGDEFADLVARIVLIQRDFWRDDDQPYFLVTMIPLEDNPNSLSIGGTGLTHSFATFVTPNASLENLQFLLAHEYFHHWNSPKLGGLKEPEQLLYWFSEGFTDYYAYRLLLLGGLIDLEKYAAKYNEFLADYYLSRERNASNERVLRDFFKDYEIGKLPYRRGFLLATRWSEIIRRQTGGRQSLDDVMREIYADAKRNKYGKLTKERILAYLAKYARHDFAADLEKYVERGETIGDLDGALGECFETIEARFGQYELGFDLDTLLKENRIARVVEKSAAYRAGLRDGQIVKGRSIYYNNPNYEVRLEIEENGERRRIGYLPVTAEKIATPQFKLKDGLSTEGRKSCLGGF